MCDDTFGQRVRKLSKRINKIDEENKEKKSFMTPSKRKPEDVDSN